MTSREGEGVYREWAKRTLDVLLVLMVSLPVALVIVVLALMVARDGHNPFYRQKRIGRDGRIFGMWKLRTMVPDADRVFEFHLERDPSAREEWRVTQKLKDDPRITPLGATLRATSLDELPQLWNVFLGEMSLVGPRPMMVSQQSLYPGSEYYQMRPGVTGFWQVSDRNETSFSERAEYDRAYFHRMSFLTDIWVMIRTLGVVVRATGH